MYMSIYIWPASVTGSTMANIKVCASAELMLPRFEKDLPPPSASHGWHKSNSKLAMYIDIH